MLIRLLSWLFAAIETGIMLLLAPFTLILCAGLLIGTYLLIRRLDEAPPAALEWTA